jgi:hypothetical protein
MKNFVKENWYNLMIGSSMLIFSISALIYSASPVLATTENNTQNTKPPTEATTYDFYVTVDQNNGETAIYGHLTGTLNWERVKRIAR